MTGLFRKTMLLGVTGLFVASAAMANVPDPLHSTLCNWVRVVGFQSAGVPDVQGLCCITVRDFANNPISGIRVDIDFSGCCDIVLCQTVLANQTLKQCSNPTPVAPYGGGQIISGYTDAAGVFCFYAVGSAKDNGAFHDGPGVSGIYPGGGLGAVKIIAGTAPNTVVLGTATAVSVNQDGARNPPGAATDLVNALDILRESKCVGSSQLGSPYKGRCDCDCNGVLNAADILCESKAAGRYQLGGFSSCVGNFCVVPKTTCP